MIKTIQDLISTIPEQYIHSCKYIKSTMEDDSNDIFSFEDDNTIVLPSSEFKNHCFSKGFLYYSAGYQKAMNERKVVLINETILFDLNLQKKARVSIIGTLKYDTDIEILKILQKYGYMRSSYDLGLGKTVKYPEVVHHLEDVFDGASYKNSKKRSQRLVQPLKVIENNNITLRRITEKDTEAVDAFCETWTNVKLEDPKVFKMMFSNPNKHIKMAIADGTYGEVWGYFIEDKLINLQLFYVEGEYAYSLYNVTTRDESIDARINAACYLHIMTQLKDRGVKHWNVGLALNPSLSAFKHHYPSEDVSYLHYPKSKEQ